MDVGIAEKLWVCAEPNVFVTKEEYINSLQGYQVETYEIAGKLAFVALYDGPEFHFHSFETDHVLPFSKIKSFLRRLIDAYGYAQTRTPHADERQHRFNKLIGFEEIDRDEWDVIYRIERIRGCH